MTRVARFGALCALTLGIWLAGSVAHAQYQTRSLTCDSPKTCEAQCNAGVATSCTSLANMHHKGLQVRADIGEAAALYDKACKLEEPWACLEYSQLFLTGWMFEVERSRERFEELFDRARKLADAGCVAGRGKSTGNSCLALAELGYRFMEREQWAKPVVEKRLQPALRAARRGCRAGHVDSCRWLHERAESLSNRSLIKAKQAGDLKEIAEKQYPRSCRKGDMNGCYYAARYTDDNKAKKNFLEPACKQGQKYACRDLFEVRVETMDEQASQITDESQMMTILKPLLDLAFKSCEGRGHEDCDSISEVFFEGEKDMGIEKDTAGGLRLLENRCRWGIRSACDQIGTLLSEGHKDYGIKKNKKRAVDNLERACLLTPVGEDCQLCKRSAGNGICLARNAWQRHVACVNGEDSACEAVADHFREGRGLKKDPARAARYYRRACDAAVKSACGTLNELCLAHSKLGDELCHQSLIHTDLFYEAEWQFRQKGSASILTGESAEPAAEIQAKVGGSVSASATARLDLSRGSLDADLVVSIVLDRARQAAIRLVVDELKRAGHGDDVPRYLYDLLTQASLLLADTSTLRREKFQDLAMTVVRSFVASNLMKTLFPDKGSLVGAKSIARLTRGKLDLSELSDRDERLLRRYMTDWTYYLLGQTKIFGRAAGEQARYPVCPFTKGPGAALCKVFSRPDGSPDLNKLMAMLHVDVVLQGIALAKMVRSEGAIDLRRFVEAIGKSRSIANLMSTPGLDLDQWESEVIIGFRTQMTELQEQLQGLAQLVQSARKLRADIENPVEVMKQMAVHADLVSKLLGNQLYATALGRENHKRALELAQLIQSSATKLSQRGPLAGAAVAGDSEAMAVIVADVKAVFRRWDNTAVGECLERSMELLKRLKSGKHSVAELTSVVNDIRALMGRLAKGKGSFDVSDLPLHEIPELKDLFQRAAVALTEIDKDVQAVFPGASRTKVRFAVSAVVRLLGFLDLMERIARKARLNQTCGHIIKAMKILGSVKNSQFSAPLFDIMDPVLHAIETHEPMNTDLLFAMIARVRLDSLITSLADNAKQPCSKGGRSTECWTVKVIHALQESIERDGDIIRIDGGKFAKRLASHGDDFRRRNKWRSFFHLTVGFGGLYSLSPPLESGGMTIDGADRAVPMIGEQIGFGWASPAFWHERLTFKTGIFASGILYRAVLDSAESNAIMVSPFVALDVYDLVEIYAAPTAMFYPPIDDQNVGVRFGAMVGLSVPLSDYLQKL